MTVLIMNSATQVLTFLIMATDHLTGATGQSPTVRFSKNGATAFASATQAVTEMQYGWYKLTLATNNVDTMGELAVHATATKGDDTDEKHYVGPVNANAIWWASATVVSPAISGMPKVDLQAVLGTTATTGAAMIGVNVYSWATATGSVPTPTQPGRPLVDLTHINGTAATTNTAQIGVNVIQWATGTLATPNTTGVPKVDLISIGGTTATTGAAMLGVNVYSWATATGLVPAPTVVGRPLVDLSHINGTAATTGTAHIGVNVRSWSTATGTVVTPNAPGLPLVDLQAVLGTTATTGTALIGVNTVNAGGTAWNSGAIQSLTFAANSLTASGMATGFADKIADQVWDELAAGHTATTSFGAILQALGSGADPWATALPGAYTATQAGGIVGNFLDVAVSSRSTATQGATAAVIADAVWDELAAGHTATTSFGAIVQAITGGGATASDYLTTAVPGAYSPGSAGYALGTYLDATVSSRLASASYTAAPTAIQNADALLTRDMSAVTEGSGRTPLQALRFLRNKWTLATTGALTIYKEDDATTSWSATATGDSASTPVTGIDPA